LRHDDFWMNGLSSLVTISRCLTFWFGLCSFSCFIRDFAFWSFGSGFSAYFHSRSYGFVSTAFGFSLQLSFF
jgi:hypothetical protein